MSDKPFHVDVPALADPVRTTVLTTDDDPPWGWLVMAFPPEVAFAQLKGNFPKGPAFSAKIESNDRRPQWSCPRADQR